MVPVARTVTTITPRSVGVVNDSVCCPQSCFGSHHDVTRTIDALSTQTLHDLHEALQGLRIKPGQRIAYVFDFADEWRVNLLVKSIIAPDCGEYPRIIEGGAQAPPQYPDWDEDAA